MIATRRHTGEDTGDLLSMLMAGRDEDTGEGMSDRQLRDEVMTIFLAGHETTAIALGWTWHLLSNHPTVAQRLRDELATVLAGRAPRRNCWKECRVDPFVGLVAVPQRVAERFDDVVGGNTQMGDALLEHRQDRPNHATDGADLVAVG